jgi:outer membrane protein assembly factor BamB
MASKSETIFVGTRGFVAALDAESGEQVWRTRFPTCAASSQLTMLLKGGRLFVGYADRAYCLESNTGAILWTNDVGASDDQSVRLAMPGATECVSEGVVAVFAQA